jgi:hypothetical protein
MRQQARLDWYWYSFRLYGTVYDIHSYDIHSYIATTLLARLLEHCRRRLHSTVTLVDVDALYDLVY